MKFSEYILEGRVDDFKSKYAQKFSNEVLDRMAASIQPKYLMWAGSVIDPINLEDNLNKVVYALDNFDKLSSNLVKTDINQYKSLNELIEALQTYSNKERRQFKQVEGGNVVYEDKRFYVVNPLTHQSSCYYGKGTKWCTAADSNHHFNEHNSDGKLFYIIDKALPTSDPNYKVALLLKFDGDKSFWSATDEKMKNGWFETHNPFHKQIMSAVDDYMNENYKEQIELYKDKERVKEEKKRQERLRIQRMVNERQEEAQERRETGEWDLTNPNIDEEGLNANALLKYLESQGDYQILTNQDREKIASLRSEIERLNAEYEASNETRTDLLDSVTELEDELESYSEYIDVYSLTPTGEFYEMQEFQLVTEINGASYAVGDAREMQETAEEYIEQLIDDVGYDGFNKNFVNNYIDEESVIEYFRDFYSDDVNDNPESYFEDDQRNLSKKQQDQIKFNRNKIEQIKTAIDNFTDMMDDMEDEEEIESLQERIDGMEEQVTELEEEIEEIESEPDGDFPDDLIEEKIDELAEDVRGEITYKMEEFGLSINDYIDKDAFIQGVIDEDGYGTVNGYDGSADEVYVKNVLFYVMRIN